MFSVSIPELKATVRHVVFEEHEPLMAWGQPGVGKSEAIAQMCAEMLAVFVDIRLSQYDSVDMRGVPDVQFGQTVWNPPSTMPFKGNPNFDETAPYICILFDEINSAQNSVQAVAYQIINDRRCGEHVLMDNVVMIAAGNRETDKGVTNKMPTPLANRFTHVEVELNTEAWVDHATEIGLHPIGIGFIQFRKPLLSTFLVTKDGNTSVTLNKAFATPRTWRKAFKYYASTTMPENIKRIAMAGAVGTGEAGEFWGFVDVYQSIQKLIPSILKNPTTADVPDDEKSGVRYAVTIALSGMMTVANAKAIHTYITRLDAEFVVLCWQLALKRDDNLLGTPEFLLFSQQYKKVFQP